MKCARKFFFLSLVFIFCFSLGACRNATRDQSLKSISTTSRIELTIPEGKSEPRQTSSNKRTSSSRKPSRDLKSSSKLSENDTHVPIRSEDGTYILSEDELQQLESIAADLLSLTDNTSVYYHLDRAYHSLDVSRLLELTDEMISLTQKNTDKLSRYYKLVTLVSVFFSFVVLIICFVMIGVTTRIKKEMKIE